MKAYSSFDLYKLNNLNGIEELDCLWFNSSTYLRKANEQWTYNNENILHLEITKEEAEEILQDFKKNVDYEIDEILNLVEQNNSEIEYFSGLEEEFLKQLLTEKLKHVSQFNTYIFYWKNKGFMIWGNYNQTIHI